MREVRQAGQPPGEPELFALVGGGWYKDLYSSTNNKAGTGNSSSSTGSSSSESKPAKSESKSEKSSTAAA
ncbi:MAG: hypothetical protein QM765_52450 [Myxococcales bacterium]